MTGAGAWAYEDDILQHGGPPALLQDLKGRSFDSFSATLRAAAPYTWMNSVYQEARIKTNNFDPGHFGRSVYNPANIVGLGDAIYTFGKDTPGHGGAQLPVSTVNEEFGLDLPEDGPRDTISQELAVELFHEQVRKEHDQYLLRNNAVNPVEFLAGGVVASGLDPAELTAAIYLPVVKGLRYLNVGAKFIPRGARVMAAKTLKRPYLGSALEGGVGNALFAPTIMSSARTTGLDYGPADAGFDVLAGVGLGVGVRAATKFVGARLRPKPVDASDYLDAIKAQAGAQADLMQGKVSGTSASAQLTGGRLADELAESAQQAESDLITDLLGAADEDAANARAAQPADGPRVGSTRAPDGPRLPFGLSNIGGHYSKAKLFFANTIDQALYTIGQATDNDNHARIMQWLKDNTGMDEAALLALRSKFRTHLKNHIDGSLATNQVVPEFFKVADEFRAPREGEPAGGKTAREFADQPLADETPSPRQEAEASASRTPEEATSPRQEAEAGPVRTPEEATSPRQEAEAGPVRTPEEAAAQPIVFNDPHAQRHMSNLETHLAAIVDPQGMQAHLTQHIEAIFALQAQLAEILELRGSEFLDNLDTARAIEREMLALIEDLREAFPGAEDIIDTVTFKENKNKLLTKRSREALGKAMRELREMALSERSDAEIMAYMQERLAELNATLAKHQAKYQELKTKGQSTKKTSEKMQLAAAQAAHVQGIIRSLGGEVAPSAETASLRTMVQAMGEEASPALRALAEGEDGDELFRTVRRNIKDNVRKRLKSTAAYVRNLAQQPDVPHADRLPLVQKLEEYLQNHRGDALSPDRALELAQEGIDAEIAAAKELGLFNEGDIKFLESEAAKHQADLDKIDAVRKGSFQAQICALGGIDE